MILINRAIFFIFDFVRALDRILKIFKNLSSERTPDSLKRTVFHVYEMRPARERVERDDSIKN